MQWNLVASDGDNNFAVVTAGGVSDKAQVWRQAPGDTWYQYPTPEYFVAPGPNVVVGSTVTIGDCGFIIMPQGGVNRTPFQSSCTWSSSNTAVATVDTHGQVTGVSPGSVTITCGRAGNGNFSTTSSFGGWVSPGDVIALTVVAGGTGNTTWYVRPDGGTTLFDQYRRPVQRPYECGPIPAAMGSKWSLRCGEISVISGLMGSPISTTVGDLRR